MSGTTADPLSSEFEVKLNLGTEEQPAWETYVFRKPGIRFQIEVGYRSGDVRRRAYPPAAGGLGDFSLDYNAVQFSRYCAYLELYMLRSDADPAWTHSPGPDGKPTVDFDKFPAEREDTVVRLGQAFEAEVARFRARGNPDGTSPGAQTVAGQ